MSIHSMLITVMAIFAAIGAIDRIIGNRLGLGQAFEDGIIDSVARRAKLMAAVVAELPEEFGK